ncbi:MAG: hypothetical protein M3Y05_16165 [Gemmatimonadota bacterium]|nr:hypothetical protein [Gemmatimonadota bacterium]
MIFGLRRRSPVLIAVIGAAALGGDTLRAQGGSCAGLYAAQRKLLTTPHHGYSVDSSATDPKLHGGKPLTSESIFTGNAIFTMYKGTWRRSLMTVDQMRTQEEENIRSAKSTCSVSGNESVNGEATIIYQVHSVTDFGTTDGQEWVSKSRGLPLRTVSRLDVGGAMGRSVIVQRYDYSNVALPAGVK